MDYAKIYNDIHFNGVPSCGLLTHIIPNKTIDTEMTFKLDHYFYAFNFYAFNGQISTVEFPHNHSRWLHGIIFKKSDLQYLEKLMIHIGGQEIISINFEILIKLFSKDINKDLILIKLPRKYFIVESFDQSLYHNNEDIKTFKGFPSLKYYEIRLIIHASERINHCVIFDYSRINNTNLVNANMFGSKMDIAEYKKIEEYTSDNYLLCDTCYKNYIMKNNNDLITYKSLRLGKIIESNCSLIPIMKLIFEYDSYDDVIIFLVNEKNEITYYKKNIYELTFDGGIMECAYNKTTNQIIHYDKP